MTNHIEGVIPICWLASATTGIAGVAGSMQSSHLSRGAGPACAWRGQGQAQQLLPPPRALEKLGSWGVALRQRHG